MKRTQALFFLFFLPLFLPAQESKMHYPVQYGSRFHYGFLIAHTRNMRHLVKSHTVGLELNYGWQLNGKKSWQQSYNYPDAGFIFYCADVGNRELFGKAIAVIPYMNFPFIRKGNFLFSFRLGSGLGYVQKSFDRLDNYKNNAIGSKINGIMHGNFETSWSISKNIRLNFAVGLTHFSNGIFKAPNLGINVPTANLGFSYGIRFSDISLLRDSLPPKEKKIYFNITGANGVKEKYPAGGKKYITFTLSASSMKPLGRKSHIGAGADLFYDGSLLQKFREDSVDKTALQTLRSGIHIGHELLIGKLRVVLQSGAYVLDPYKLDGPWYNRIGFKYYVTEKIFANFTLKTHIAKADFLEWGVGWRW